MKSIVVYGLLLVKLTAAQLTILTFNDVYEIIPDSFGRGGFAEMMSLLEQEREKSEHHITTINGDFLSPSILSIFDHGKHKVELFNEMGVDFVVVGNHEFDFGPEVVLERVAESKFPWLAANALGLDGSPFTGKKQLFVIDVDDIKVGIFGLITTETPELSSTDNKVCFSPLVLTARHAIKKLKQQGADVIIALTHLLMEEDYQLATEVPEIDLILGGHDHDVLTNYNDKTLIHKSGLNAYYLTRLDLFFEKTPHGVKILPSWNVILNRGMPKHELIGKQVDDYQRELNEFTKEKIGEIGIACDTLSSNVSSKETIFGNFVADALRDSCGADVAIIPGGILRGNCQYQVGYVLTLKDLMLEMPFGNVNVAIEMTGAAIVTALENGVSQVEGKAGKFPQVSGLVFSYDINQSPGKRVYDVTIQGKTVDLEKIYKVATVDYLLKGGDGYFMMKESKVLLSPLKAIGLVPTVADYIRHAGKIANVLEGRITPTHKPKELDQSQLILSSRALSD